MTTFAFPTLITNVIAALKAAIPVATATIYDGAETDRTYPKDWIAVGHDGSEGLSEIRVLDSRNEYQAFGEIHSEDGVLHCFLVAQDGGSTLTQLRVRAYSLLSTIDTTIRSDPTFSGAVLSSWLETHSTGYRKTNVGAACDIYFTLAYKAST